MLSVFTLNTFGKKFRAKMRITAAIVVLLVVDTFAQNTHVDPQEEYETAVRKAFDDAYANRTDELQDFFNQTFGAGGNATEVAERFKIAWKSASEGVKQFVGETYQNISRIMSTNTTEVSNELIASLSNMDEIDSRIASYSAVDENKDTDSTTETGRLDAIWNYFKNLFGKPKETASMTQPVNHHTGVYLGLLTMLAALFLAFQTTLNRNSLLNKHVQHEYVPRGYVRIT